MALKTCSQKSTLMVENWEFAAAYEEEANKDRVVGIKCPDTTKKFRAYGAVFERTGFYINAVEMYNQGLCLAPPKTVLLGILYAKRANAFFRMGLYCECLASLKLALDNHYPDDLRHHLDNKMKLCRKLLTEKAVQEKQKCCAKEQKFYIRLSYPANPRVPSVIQDMHVEENDEFGRHVIADRDLQVGDVICIEDAFVKCIQPQQRFNRCTNCLQELPHLLFPCETCTNAMFCSVSCQRSAWTAFHQIECCVSDELNALELDSARLAFRTFLLAMNLFHQDITAFQKFLADNCDLKRAQVTGFDLDHRKLCKRDQFLAFYNGFSDDRHVSLRMRIVTQQHAVSLAVLLGEYSSYWPQLQCAKTRSYIINMLRHFIAINSNNCYEIGNPTKSAERSSTGLGLYLCMSMAAHSCSGNVSRLRVDGTKQIWMVCRPIAAGGQIFDNYGSYFMSESRAERQKRCLTHYGFKCVCEACEKDYPTQENLPAPKAVPFLKRTYLSDTEPMTLKMASAEMKLLRGYQTKYNCYFPCRQLREAEVRLMQLFQQLADDEILETRHPEFFTNVIPSDEWNKC